MTKEEIKKIIIEEILNIAPDIDEEEIPLNENLQLSIEIDSYDFLNILVALAERLGIEVPEADYTKVDTLERMIAYFNEKVKPSD